MKRYAWCLLMLAVMLALTACSTNEQPEQHQEAAIIQWPASDAAIHTAQSGSLSKAAERLMASNAGLHIGWMKIDDITLYEIYPTDAANLPMLFMLHELGTSKEEFLPEAITYAQAGYFCVLLDMTGHGERISPDAVESIEAAVLATADIDVLLEYYRLSPCADSSRFALYGQSMGGSAVWHYVAYGKHTPAAIVIACAAVDFSNMRDLGCVRNGKECKPQWSEMEYAEYCSVHNPMIHQDRLVSVPMLVFQGLQDTVVDPNVAQAFERCVSDADNQNATFVYDEKAAHAATPSFIARIIPFLKQFLR